MQRQLPRLPAVTAPPSNRWPAHVHAGFDMLFFASPGIDITAVTDHAPSNSRHERQHFDLAYWSADGSTNAYATVWDICKNFLPPRRAFTCS